jgi:DHA2 family multidrug resistance protein
MFNLMRNLGGSFGIAGATTYLFRRQQLHTHILGADVSPFNPRVQVMRSGMETAMIAHGADPVSATRQSYASLWGLVQHQASMLSFVDTFLALAVVFLLVLPLLLAMKRPKYSSKGMPGH